ncbi:MAG: hypothetical protein U5K27_01915 [Desulfotignum sp.]|nr:hypothetical protein [Desulfotignum sp.]
MNQTFKILSRRFLAAFSVIFREAARQADHAVLSRHIIALNKKTSSTDIINELSVCLKTPQLPAVCLCGEKRSRGRCMAGSRDVQTIFRTYHFSRISIRRNPASTGPYLNDDFVPGGHRENRKSVHINLDHLDFLAKFSKIIVMPVCTWFPENQYMLSMMKAVQPMLQGRAAALSRASENRKSRKPLL